MLSRARRYRSATVAVTVVCVAVAGCSSAGNDPPPGAPGSVEVHGDRLDYAGLVPWGNPVSDPDDPSAVYVFADNDRTTLTIPACGVSADRALVEETSTSVTVTIAGYAYRVPEGANCLAVGHASVPVRVKLSRPLGDRTLVDDHGKTHRVLDASAIPMPTGIDASCTAAPLRWNERTGLAYRNWDGPRARCPLSVQYGPSAVVDGINVGLPGRSIDIHGTTARIWKYQTRHPPRFGLTIRWTLTAGHEIQLTTGTETRADALSSKELIALARSMR